MHTFRLYFFIVFPFLVIVSSSLYFSSSTNIKKTIKTKNYKVITVNSDVFIENYFPFMDSIINKYDSLTSYKLTEHLLIRANHWVIDTLKNTDYYIQKKRDSFIYNQKKMIVLNKGAFLVLPDSVTANKLTKVFNKTKITINIPEFSLRIINDTTELYKFPIRVGKNQKKFLKMSGRLEDLRTKTGIGSIVGYNKNPEYFNPVNNKQYYVTKRDDKRVTKLPQIPFIETEINGFRHGQMIHPTTNPITLGKASSNGCIGTHEGDAWVIYYYAPIGTEILIKYNLQTATKIPLKDIYGYRTK